MPLSDRDLTLRDLRVFRLREPVSRRGYTVLSVTTENGFHGYGECAALSDAEVASTRQVVLGRPATAYEAVRRDLTSIPAAQAAVNIALLDVVGQAAKAPVYQVLGGPTRNKVRALAPLQGDSDAAVQEAMKRASAAGHRAFLVPLPATGARNQGQAFVHAVKRRLDSLRQAGGDQVDFVLQADSKLTPGDAGTIAEALERFHLLWFDEPCRISNQRAARKLADENVTPLGFGRSLNDAGQFQDLLREEVADILRPDLGRHGISQIRRIAVLAETHYMAVAPYHDGGPIGTAAAFQLAASLPNFFIQQIPNPEAGADRRMRAEIAGDALEKVSAGYAALPKGAGLGITVNEEALKKYEERA